MTEARSHFVEPVPDQLPSTTDPCGAPEGYYWVHAFNATRPPIDRLQVGKWLIRVGCPHVAYCWGQVCRATEDGELGISAKVSTDWGNQNDPAAAPGGWRVHVICVYTYNWADKKDVGRVAKRLREIDAVRKQILYYKPDAFTYAGRYSQNAPGEVAIYEAAPPYEILAQKDDALALLRDVIQFLARRVSAGTVQNLRD